MAMRVISATGSATLRRGSAGFTLIELLVVLAILLMIGGIFPFVLKRALPHQRIVLASQQLRAAIHDAEIRSQGTGEPRVLDSDTLDKLLPNGTHMMMVAPDGTELKALAVYPDGSITAGRIDISAGVQHQMVVTTVLTGRVVLR